MMDEILPAETVDSRIQKRAEGKEKRENTNIWITIRRDAVHAAVEALMEIWYPHLSCIAGYDKGADSPDLRVQYIFSIYGGVARSEYMVIFSLDVPKDDARLPTITDLLEGTAPSISVSPLTVLPRQHTSSSCRRTSRTMCIRSEKTTKRSLTQW